MPLEQAHYRVETFGLVKQDVQQIEIRGILDEKSIKVKMQFFFDMQKEWS